MLLAALFDLGASPERVKKALKTVDIGDFQLEFRRRKDSGGILYGHCKIELEEQYTHRHLSNILKLLDSMEISARVRRQASDIFHRLAEAEAAVHGIDKEKVHFHEVGALDTIIDVVGACIALEELAVDKIFYTSFKTGHGTVKCAHGILPVPVPAVAELLKGHRVTRVPEQGEMTTPTGAAILTTLAETDDKELSGTLLATGNGHGQKDWQTVPNILRAQLLESESPDVSQVEMLETDIDDDTPEMLGLLMEKLKEEGALDVTATPMTMKKSRPATRISVLSPLKLKDKLAQLIFSHSSTIGIRINRCQRLELPRQSVRVETQFGSVEGKKIQRPNGVEIVPESRSCAETAAEQGVTPRRVYCEAHRWISEEEDIKESADNGKYQQ